MTYSQWKKQMFSALNAAPVRLFDFTEDSFPTIDLKALYRAGFSPERAGELAKGINWFTKPEYKEKPSATVQSFREL